MKGTEIDEATLQSIKAEVDTLEIGEIRYDSVQSCGYDYYIVDPDTGRHILTGQRDMDSVMEISDHYDGVILFSKSVFSPRKANQLDCAYALIGIEKQPNEFKIEAIPNSAIGQAPTILELKLRRNRLLSKIQVGHDGPVHNHHRGSAYLVLFHKIISTNE